MATKKAEEVQKVQLAMFSKEQILASARYANRKDLVNALLEDGKKYTTETIDKLIDEFMKGKVNE